MDILRDPFGESMMIELDLCAGKLQICLMAKLTLENTICKELIVV